MNKMVGVAGSGSIGACGYKLFLKQADVCVPYMKKNLNEEKEREIANILRDYLDARSVDVIVRYYGIAQQKETLEQIGKSYGMSANGVRSVRVRAMHNIADDRCGAREALVKFYDSLP